MQNYYKTIRRRYYLQIKVASRNIFYFNNTSRGGIDKLLKSLKIQKPTGNEISKIQNTNGIQNQSILNFHGSK